MKDIDKDIETLKKVQGIFEHLKTHGWINDIKRDVDTDTVILSIENVLSELQIKDKMIDNFAKRVYRKIGCIPDEVGRKALIDIVRNEVFKDE